MFYWVFDFFELYYFFVLFYQDIYEKVGYFIWVGKIVLLIILKIFYLVEVKIVDFIVIQFFLCLVGDVVLIINVEDYGCMIYDFVICCNLIWIGEDMVNIVFDVLIDVLLNQQIDDVECCLFDLVEIGCSDGGFVFFGDVFIEIIEMVYVVYNCEGVFFGIFMGLCDFDCLMGGLQ